jgi:hypothetical protein
MKLEDIIITLGPGILARPDHHAPPDGTSPNLVPIDIFRSVGQVIIGCFIPFFSCTPLHNYSSPILNYFFIQPAPNFATWRISHSGGDVNNNKSVS